MNIQKHTLKVLQLLSENPVLTQRDLAKALDLSLSHVNKLLKSAQSLDFLQIKNAGAKQNYQITSKARDYIADKKVDNAIILAAGFGSRFVPFTLEKPKGLLEVMGEPMLERQIKQLIDRGIKDITLVVGYLKEAFEYLIDLYGVKLVYNPEYNSKNNLASLYCVRHLLKNTYILTSDSWFRENVFQSHEEYAWYSSLYSETHTKEWCLRLGHQQRIRRVSIGGEKSWYMYGPVFFSREFSEKITPMIEEYYARPGTENYYWEHILMQNCEHLIMYAQQQSPDVIYEFESVEELRDFDEQSVNQSSSDILSHIAHMLSAQASDISDIQPLKSGVSNHSFRFACQGITYVFRYPIPKVSVFSRPAEHAALQTIATLDISDQLIAFDEKSGAKLSLYLGENIASTKGNEEKKLEELAILRKLHHSGLRTGAAVDLKKQIQWYEKAIAHTAVKQPLYRDYEKIKKALFLHLDDLKKQAQPTVLCHGDCTADNFYHTNDGRVYLLDWEYAGMADPLLDVAIYALGQNMADCQLLPQLLADYLQRIPTPEELRRCHVYAASVALSWAIWAMYEISRGTHFGTYGMDAYHAVRLHLGAISRNM